MRFLTSELRLLSSGPAYTLKLRRTYCTFISTLIIKVHQSSMWEIRHLKLLLLPLLFLVRIMCIAIRMDGWMSYKQSSSSSQHIIIRSRCRDCNESGDEVPTKQLCSYCAWMGTSTWQFNSLIWSSFELMIMTWWWGGRKVFGANQASSSCSSMGAVCLNMLQLCRDGTFMTFQAPARKSHVSFGRMRVYTGEIIAVNISSK